MSLIIFEDELARNFYPLTLTRASFELLSGTKTLLDNLVQRFRADEVALYTRNSLKAILRQRMPKYRVSEFEAEGDIVLVNGLLNTNAEGFNKIVDRKGRFVAVAGTSVAAAKIPGRYLLKLGEKSDFPFTSLANGRNYDRLEMGESSLYHHPWELVDDNANAIIAQARGLSSEKISLMGVFENGPLDRVLVSSTANLEAPITIDTRNGPVIVEERAEIKGMSRLEGPCYIGRDAKVRSALIGEGTSIGESCVVGGEVEHSIIAGYSNKAHLGYLGHSVVGSWVNLGAQTTNSNLKNTYGVIKINVGGERLSTSRIKAGCYIADNAKTAIGTLILAGKKIGVASHAYGNVADDVPSFTIYAKSLDKELYELALDSAIETQKRMMIRRGVKQTREDVDLLKRVFDVTRAERKSKGVKKGKFKI